ncbi:MAG: hypothetical protein GWN14_05210 [candidate division Zixibacteria bacterium]|nr:hypothetical protein [candidate division Zixibacteria bacterium]
MKIKREEKQQRRRKKKEQMDEEEAKREEMYQELSRVPLRPEGYALKTAAGESFIVGKPLLWLKEAGRVTAITMLWAQMPNHPVKKVNGDSVLIKTITPPEPTTQEPDYELVMRVSHEGPYFHDIWPKSGNRITARLVPVEPIKEKENDDV